MKLMLTINLIYTAQNKIIEILNYFILLLFATAFSLILSWFFSQIKWLVSRTEFFR
jgi:hypothetical protein